MDGLDHFYWRDDGAWLGYLLAFPEFWTQGETRDDLEEHLRALFSDLRSMAAQN